MKQNQFKEKVILCLKTGYPLIFVFSMEEERAIQLVVEAVDEFGKGISLPSLENDTMCIRDLIGFIPENSLLLLDIFKFSIHEKETIRALADSAKEFSKNRRTIVMVCPFLEIPKELDRFSTSLHLPLPDDELLYSQCIKAEEDSGISISDQERENLVRIMRGLTSTSAYYLVKKAFLSFNNNINQMRESVIEEKKCILNKSRILESIDIPLSISDVGGMDQLKDWLISRKDAFSDSARSFGLPCPRGLILMGLQGCGKSMMAKVVAHYWEIPLVRLDIASLFGSTNPDSQLKEAFRVLEAMSQTVLWIDEIEKAFDSVFSGVGVRLLGELLTWLQENKGEVFVIATANGVDNLPSELLRKGRFDEIFFIDLPNVSERCEILEIQIKKYFRNPNLFDLESLAKKCENFSGSELEQLIISGLFYAFTAKRELENADLFRACKEIVPLFDMFEENMKLLREWASKRARPASTNRTKLDLFSK
jgi:SpoVK/Ycf46/Vps4 family AAA+-type ATPase